MKWLAIALVMFLLSSVALAQKQQLLLEDFDSEANIPNAWKPNLAAEPVKVIGSGQSGSLKLDCNFSQRQMRAYWDKQVKLDLSGYNYIGFKVKLANPEQLMLFSVYFQGASGGWWTIYQSVNLTTDQWQDVALPLSAFVMEGETNGWKDIRTIRISIFCNTGAGRTRAWVSDLKAMLVGESKNMLLNSSFEYASVKGLPEHWGTEHWGLRSDMSWENYDAWREAWYVDDTIKHSGKRSLRITGSADLTDRMLASRWVSLSEKQPYTLSVWLRSDRAGLPVEMTVESVGKQQVSVGTDWKRYVLSGTAASTGTFRCMIGTTSPGRVWIDDIQLEPGLKATEYAAVFTDGKLKNLKAITRPVRQVPDYPTIAGAERVKVEIDKHRRFLVDGQPFIPFAMGFEGVPSSVAIRETARAGYNSICFTPGQQQYPLIRHALDSAKANGLKVILWFPSFLSIDEFSSWIESFRTHPAIIAWYIYDEPSEITPDIVNKYNLAKKLDPGRPAYVNYVFYPNDMLGDIASRDWYPIPDALPGNMGKATDELELPSVKSGKPSWIWLQTIGYAYYISREPWETETECMAYASLIHGARGIKYFVHRPHNEATWDQLKLLAREVRQLTPVLYSLEPSPKIKVLGESIDYTVKTYKGRKYLITLNLKPVNNKASFAASGSKSVTVLFESRTLKPAGGRYSDSFGPYQRHVYRLD